MTVIVPARDEARDIADCLHAVGEQTYPLDRIEVLVVDGASTDGTSDTARVALASYGFHRSDVVLNDAATTPSSLNVGLARATGHVICRVDARSLIPRDYVETCVELLDNPNIAVVGGAQVPEHGGKASLVERAIVRALRNPYTTGLARYRRNDSSGPTDTTYLGAFRRSDLLAAGGWDERFLTNQDFELNRRMARRGTVWFEADLRVGYRPRRSLTALARQHRRFGRWKAAGWLEAGVEVLPRQAALLLAPALGAILFSLLFRRRPWIVLSAVTTTAIAVERKGDGPAPLSERAISFVASGVLTASWWLGVVEQALRHLAGGRLISSPEHRG